MNFLHEIQEFGQSDFRYVNYELIFWVMMGLNLLFIAIAKTANQNYIGILFNTAIVNRQLHQKIQEELKLGSISSILLTLTYFINLGCIGGYLAINSYGVLALLILGILLAAALIKWVVMWGLMFISENRVGVSEHGMNHLIYYQVGGLILTPVLIFSHFLPAEYYEYAIMGSIGFAAFLVIFRELQSMARAFKSRISVLYIILYLCTLELMPLVLIIYAFVNNYNGLN